MTDPVNLNRFRKEKRRADAKKTAEQNRVTYGRTKAERAAAQDLQSRQEKSLDGKEREPPGDE